MAAVHGSPEVENALEHERRHAGVEARVEVLERHPILEPRVARLEARVLILERVGLAALTAVAGAFARLAWAKVEVVLQHLAGGG